VKNFKGRDSGFSYLRIRITEQFVSIILVCVKHELENLLYIVNKSDLDRQFKIKDNFAQSITTTMLLIPCTEKCTARRYYLGIYGCNQRQKTHYII